jgi:hypothetical protein
MKRFVLFVTALFLFILATDKVFAQDFTADKAYQDYQYQLTNYRQAYDDFQETRTFYKRNPTLQLREEARKKTLTMLKSRDQLMIVYLTAIRMQIVESTGFTNDDKATIYSKLDPEVSWYQTHVNSYQDGDDLNTLFTKSNESKDRYNSLSKAVIYNTLFDTTLSQEIGLRIDHQLIYSDLKNLLNDKVSRGEVKIDPFNRWLSDTDNILISLGQNEASAKTLIPNFYTLKYNLVGTYNSGVDSLDTSVGPLGKLNNYLYEMLTLLKTN